MSFRKSFELSNQRLMGLTEHQPSPELTPHVPMDDLEAEAPPLNRLQYRPEEVLFPFSNDECTAPYFEQLQARTLTPEYQQADNHVAIVVGESSLAANLRFIPEETIIVIDNSPDMCIFMHEYIDGLRQSAGAKSWFERLYAVGPRATFDLMHYQVSEWANAGYTHPLADDEAFAIAQAGANEKIIIPWCADITKPEQMDKLAQVLTSHEAAVTMMNLTNVLPYTETLRSAGECAAQFYKLPLTPQAPILTTALGYLSRHGLPDAVGAQTGKANLQTGPFFGLDNLARAETEYNAHQLGTIVSRRLAGSDLEAYPATYEDTLDEILDLVLHALTRRQQRNPNSENGI